MSLTFPSHPWRISYSSNEDNLIADFYIPSLECAVQYDRKSGFFSSAILSKVARGLGAMLHNNGKMRLIMGCQFSSQDLTAIEQGYHLKEAIASRLDSDLQPPVNFVQLKHFEILSWLIAHDFLQIKIAIPLKENGLPQGMEYLLDPEHIFHEKTGIFTDEQGNKLAFSGSNNESVGGWEQNIESFHVYCSWEGGRDLERVEEEQFRFDQLWYDLAPNVRIFEFPEAVKQKLLSYTPSTKPSWTTGVEYDTTTLASEEQYITPKENSSLLEITDYTEELQQFQTLLNLHQHPGCLDYSLQSIPITPWVHQLKILRRLTQSFPNSAMISDEVGLGKTISVGLLIRYLLISRQIRRVLILTPASIQSQWHEELREKFNLHFWSYQGRELQDPYGETLTPRDNPWNSRDLILASSHLVRRAERSQELLTAHPWDLIVLDEAHHARRRNPTVREDTPNRLLNLMRSLKEKTSAIILLSATPMQIDAIEVFDLLSLLGLKGQWQYQDNFCDYFDSLSGPTNPLTLEFWQKLSVNYFTQGGQPCPVLEQYFSEKDRLLSYRLKDIWQMGQPIVNKKKIRK